MPRQKTPSAVHVSVEDFMSSPRYDEIVEQLGQTNGGRAGDVAAAPVEEAGPERLMCWRWIRSC